MTKLKLSMLALAVFVGQNAFGSLGGTPVNLPGEGDDVEQGRVTSSPVKDFIEEGVSSDFATTTNGDLMSSSMFINRPAKLVRMTSAAVETRNRTRSTEVVDESEGEEDEEGENKGGFDPLSSSIVVEEDLFEVELRWNTLMQSVDMSEWPAAARKAVEDAYAAYLQSQTKQKEENEEVPALIVDDGLVDGEKDLTLDEVDSEEENVSSGEEENA